MGSAILAFTPGEPVGIGPDLAVMMAQVRQPHCVVAIADPGMLRERAKSLGLVLTVREFDGQPSEPGVLQVIPVRTRTAPVAGKLDIRNAAYVLETLETAVSGCLDGRFDAMVTGPVQKSIINDAGIPFTGHTEFLAEQCGRKSPVMMLANEKLKVALVTTHLPLSRVCEKITESKVEQVVRIVAHDMGTRFGIESPGLVVCGLNPHAGENGHLGDEENRIIIPVLDRLRANGMNLYGPLPADTAFTPKILQTADAVIAMYHDQGLPVVKALGFGQTVNITLGLPIVRTSVDHGTALPLAGTGAIDSGSLTAALDMAGRMVHNSRTA